MLSREDAINYIFQKHGHEATYVTSIVYISRAVYNLYPTNKNIFYMQGSMGLASGIGLGLSLFSKKDIVVINGDASHLMHLGLTHTIRDCGRDNLFVYILDNGCHESVGGQKCSSLEKEYIGTTEIIKISCDGKTPRVKIGFKENARNIISLHKVD